MPRLIPSFKMEKSLNCKIQDLKEEMESKYRINIDEMIKIRKDFHMYPEGGFEEFKTSEKIINFLKENGADCSKILRMAKTGVVYDIEGNLQLSEEFAKTKKIIAIRADMDALEMLEENDHLPYRK